MRRAVIAPVDLDRKAEDTVRCAARLARLSQARLVVAHVVDDYSAESGYAPFARAGEARAAMARAAHAWLVGLLHHLGIQGAEIVVVQGGLWNEVVALAEDHRACYIVTGQSRWGFLGKLTGLNEEPRLLQLDCDIINAEARPALAREGILLG